jgi:hypothetical protein
MGHGYSTERLGEFGQALDFKWRVKLPTACMPVKIVPHAYGQATLYSMSCVVPCGEEWVSIMEEWRVKEIWFATEGSLPIASYGSLKSATSVYHHQRQNRLTLSQCLVKGRSGFAPPVRFLEWAQMPCVQCYEEAPAACASISTRIFWSQILWHVLVKVSDSFR